MPDIGGLQLLPETRKKIALSVPGENRYITLGVVFVALVLAIYFGLTSYTNSIRVSIASIDDQLANIEKSRDKKSESHLLDLNKQLGVVAPLLGTHLIWSAAFTRVQNLLLPQVQFDFFNADAITNKYVFKATAPSYTSVAKQIAAFYSDDAITDVLLSKVASQPTGKVEFTIQFYFDQNKFLLKNNRK